MKNTKAAHMRFGFIFTLTLLDIIHIILLITRYKLTQIKTNH